MNDEWAHAPYDDTVGLCNHRFGWGTGNHVCNDAINHEEIDKTEHHCICGATDALKAEIHYE